MASDLVRQKVNVIATSGGDRSAGAALLKGVRLHILEAGLESEIDTAFDRLAGQHVNGLVTQADPFYNSRAQQIVDLASLHSVSAIYEWRGIVAAGGLISYGTSLAGVYHQVGAYVGKILNGEKPADLPVLQPTKFELVLNLKTARALGLMIPASLIVSADEVIE